MRRSLLPAILAALAIAAPAEAAPVATFHECVDAPAPARCGSVVVPLDRPRAPPAGRACDGRVRALPAARRATGRRSARCSRRGRAGLLHDRQPRLLPGARRAADGRGATCCWSTPRGTGLVRARSTARRSASTVERLRRAAPARCAARARRRGVDLYGTHAASTTSPTCSTRSASRRVDLYGDSYGSYVAQAFAVRHPRPAALARARRRPTRCPAPTRRSATSPRRRSARCGSSARAGRAAPRAARTRVAVVAAAGGRGCARSRSSGTGRQRATATRIRVRLDDELAGDVLQSGYANLADLPRPPRRDPRVRRGRPRAAAAAGGREHARPDRHRPVRSFSEALYLAVTCHDYPQMWDPAAPLEVRDGRSSRRPQAALPAAQFAPFSPVAWTVARLRGRHGLPALARPARGPTRPCRPPRRTRPCRRSCSTATSTTSRASSGARVVASRFPRVDVRRDAQHDPRLGARRPRRLRRADRAPLRRAR